MVTESVIPRSFDPYRIAGRTAIRRDPKHPGGWRVVTEDRYCLPSGSKFTAVGTIRDGLKRDEAEGQLRIRQMLHRSAPTSVGLEL